MCSPLFLAFFQGRRLSLYIFDTTKRYLVKFYPIFWCSFPPNFLNRILWKLPLNSFFSLPRLIFTYPVLFWSDSLYMPDTSEIHFGQPPDNLQTHTEKFKTPTRHLLLTNQTPKRHRVKFETCGVFPSGRILRWSGGRLAGRPAGRPVGRPVSDRK